jgi:ADP-ribosyl-[dinitrogen reductase] hydrolase
MLWLDYGLNNGGRPSSIGLGGNISIAMMEFERRQEEFCEEGDGFNNGNGSLMRLAPVGVAVREEGRGMDVAARQSRTTHNGEEAMECCRLLALILIRLINRG